MARSRAPRTPRIATPKNVTTSVSTSNTGQMSNSRQQSGATGAVSNTTHIVSSNGASGASGTSVTRVQGDPGFTAGQESDVIKNARKLWGL